ncbi:chromosome 16 C19orf85 homolog [Stigmatopora argus]
MQKSVSVTMETVSERAVPWGRDLYTFVTSAAGHMMRTLQKPRKNRPSKRQVNHRRFLHTMIQRKFADIEAANRRLESALYLKEVKPLTPDREVPRENQSDNQEKQDTPFTDCSENAPPISQALTPQPLFFESPDDCSNLTDWADILDLFFEDDEATRRVDDGSIAGGLPEPLPALSTCQHDVRCSGGVAQSFWAPTCHASPHHIATPPHEDHLTFDDILVESLECTSFNTFSYQDLYT